LFCLVIFAGLFMASNNPIYGLDDGVSAQLGIIEANLTSAIFELPEDSDGLLNITANTDPTEGFLGSRDSVATSYGVTDIANVFFTSSKTLISWVFSGALGQMLLVVFGGLFGLTALYWLIKLIRNGV
jgi:hypothetical protein